MDEQDALYGESNLGGPFLPDRFFQASQRGAGARDAAVARLGILLERKAACKAARETPAVKLV